MCAAVRDDRPVVLKLTPRGHPDDLLLASEAVTLDFWRPTGAAIELLGRRDDGFTLLLDRARPGEPLLHSGLSWEQMLTELGRLARRLHRAGTPPAAIVPMSAYTASWTGAGELGELLLPSSEDVLVHLDLHPGNALRVNGGWKVIDPHGARADRHAEIWALICPEAPALPDDPVEARRIARGRLELYANAAGLDPGRAAVWTRVRAQAEADHPTRTPIRPGRNACAGWPPRSRPIDTKWTTWEGRG